MKILFLKTYRDPYNPARYYQPGWVAEFTDPDAERAIAEGFAEPAPAGAFSRKGAAPSFECAVPDQPLTGEFKETGETTDLGGLIQGKTYSSEQIKAAEKRRGFPFKKAGT